MGPIQAFKSFHPLISFLVSPMPIKDVKNMGKDYGKDLPKGDYLDCALAHNPFGCSTLVVEELKKLSFHDIHLYPNNDEKLKEALAELWNVKNDQIFLGTGSMGCLQKINKLLTPGSVILGYSPQFLPYINDARLNGAVYHYVPLLREEDFTIDVSRIIAQIDERTTFVYVDNPNNPTGQILKLKEIEELAEEAGRKGAILIVDEAFGEFMEKKNSAINLEYPNVVITRSFSKGFGLAGLRIGYCVVEGKEMRELLFKVDFPFSITNISIRAALKALEDTEFLKKTIKKTKKSKEKTIRELGRRFHIAKTHKTTPILLCGGQKDTYGYFLQKGILTVPGSEFMNLDDSYVRIRVPKDVDELLTRISSV